MMKSILFAACDSDLLTIVRFIRKGVIPIIEIVIPIVIIILGTIDLAKAALASKEDEIKAAQKMFLKRLIYAVAIFFVGLIVTVVMGLVSKGGDKTIDGNSFKECWQAAAK